MTTPSDLVSLIYKLKSPGSGLKKFFTLRWSTRFMRVYFFKKALFGKLNLVRMENVKKDSLEVVEVGGRLKLEAAINRFALIGN